MKSIGSGAYLTATLAVVALTFAAPASATPASPGAAAEGPSPGASTMEAGSSPSPASSGPGSSLPEPSTSASPATSASPLPAPAYAQWARSDLPDPAPTVYGGGLPTGIVAFNGSYVVAGTVNGDCCDGGNPSLDRGVLWSSGDGQSWSLRDPVRKFGHSSVYDLVTDGTRLVAIGSVDASTHAQPWRRAPAAWASTDGRVWTRFTGAIPTLAAASPRYLVGAITTDPTEKHSATAQFVISTDGVRWTRTSPVLDVDLRGIAVNPDGTAIAVGAVPGTGRADGTDSTDMVLWSSTDGRTWVGPQAVVTNALPTAVTWSGSDFLAVVLRDDLSPDQSVYMVSEVWHLGITESPRPAQLRLSEEHEGDYLSSIFSAGNAVFAVGDTLLPSENANAMIWVSTDGGWTFGRVADQPAFEGINNGVSGIVATPGGILAVGSRWDTATMHPLPETWLSSP